MITGRWLVGRKRGHAQNLRKGFLNATDHRRPLIHAVTRAVKPDLKPLEAMAEGPHTAKGHELRHVFGVGELERAALHVQHNADIAVDPANVKSAGCCESFLVASCREQIYLTGFVARRDII